MIKATLKRGDGIGHRVWLRSSVKTMQQALVNAGHSIIVDGLFGNGTVKAGKAFQQKNGLIADGVFNKNTWASIDSFLPQPASEITDLLVKFNGDIDWVHQQEGHRGRPYWPGGVSGVTLDPGVDLGHASAELVEKLYQPLLTNQQMAALRKIYGFKGHDARDAIRQSSIISGIRISADDGVTLMPFTAEPYWKGIVQRFSALKRKDTPASVQTVLLSLAYNRGILNRHLDVLTDPLQTKDWRGVASIIERMQQRHKLRGIRIRRRQESFVINAELDFMES